MLSILQALVTFSIWVSLAAAACPLLVGAVYEIPVAPWKPLVAFLCAFFVYSLDKISGSKEDLLNTPERAILANYPIRQLAILAYLAAFLITIATDWHKWYCVAVFGAAGLLYAIPLFHGMRLKDIPGLKAPYVALTCAICFAGLVSAGYSLIFLLILINTIIFDMRDVVRDRAAGVKSIPVLVGPSRTIYLLAALDVLFAFIHLPSGLIGAALIMYFEYPRPSLQYDILVDGWPMISLNLIYLSELESYL